MNKWQSSSKAADAKESKFRGIITLRSMLGMFESYHMIENVIKMIRKSVNFNNSLKGSLFMALYFKF